MSMQYRKLPRGEEMIGTLGLGMGGIQNAAPSEIETVVAKAIDAGINFFDLCAGGKSVYEPFGRAMRGRREKVYFQLHFGAVYGENGEYGWSRDLEEIRRTFEWEREALGTDYIDFGFLHCIDEEDDFEEICKKRDFRICTRIAFGRDCAAYRIFFAYAVGGEYGHRYRRRRYDDVFDQSGVRF